LAIRCKELCVQVKTQENRNKEGREGLSGEAETIKIVAELGEGVPQGGTIFENLRFLRKGEAIGEKGDGAVNLVKFVHGACQ